MAETREVLLNAEYWNSPDDLYDAFFAAVGAPSWHGRNFNALRDSIGTGQVNSIDVPYCIVLRNSAKVGAGAEQITKSFIDLVRELKSGGVPVEIRVEGSE